MINKNRNQILDNLQEWRKYLFHKYSTIIIISIKSGVSRQEHQNKSRHIITTKKNYVVKKQQPHIKSSKKNPFPIPNIQSSKIILTYVWYIKNPIKNAVVYVAPQNKFIVHIMNLKIRIYCVFGTSAFMFENCCQRMFEKVKYGFVTVENYGEEDRCFVSLGLGFCWSGSLYWCEVLGWKFITTKKGNKLACGIICSCGKLYEAGKIHLLVINYNL